MDRVSTGIEELDEAIGGLPSGRTVLVTGDAGSGKTVFGLQFAHRMCQDGLKTAYVATEESEGDLYMQASSFGWDLKQFEKDGKFICAQFTAKRMEEVESAIEIRVDSSKGNFEILLEPLPDDLDVLIIDSLGSHTANLSAREFKDRLDLLVYRLNKMGITTMLVLDSATSEEYNDLALFSVYGAIKLLRRENPYTGRRERVMDIVKMRNTKTPVQLLPFEMRKDGINLTHSEKQDDISLLDRGP